ncbi:hypothetical protein C8R42DRAFT_82866 [Lentinula raphanica]|nr:hypothetical protein C8R42DRAFT_82866 [Lentinula raphanica]
MLLIHASEDLLLTFSLLDLASSATSSRGKRVPASTLRESTQPSTSNASGSTGTTTTNNPTPTEPIIVDRTGIILDVLIARPADIDWLIWGGILILEGLDFPAKHPRIAVKLADWERDSEAEVVGNVSETGRVLLKEARIYEHLARVAPGSGITPHYYGTFNDSGSIAVILDYGGKRLPSNSLAKLEDSEKQALFSKAQQLHQLGIVHGYLAERNILMDEDRNFTIIDFHDAELKHKCSWNGSDGCHELKLFAGYLGLRL